MYRGELGPFVGTPARNWSANGPRETEKPRVSRAFASTATGIRTRVSAVRGRRPSPLDDSGGVSDQQGLQQSLGPQASFGQARSPDPILRPWQG